MWSHDALAKGKPPKAEDQSAVAQYRESIPTSSGPSFEGSDATRTTSLPPPVRATVTREAGRRAGLLVQVATSSAYGAPQERLPRARGTRPEGAGAGSAIAAAPGRLLESADRGRLLGLLVVLAAISAGAVVAASRSRRVTRRLVDFEHE
jgi:hypothetical protein